LPAPAGRKSRSRSDSSTTALNVIRCCSAYLLARASNPSEMAIVVLTHQIIPDDHHVINWAHHTHHEVDLDAARQ
jgi:hypothetical protein